MRSKELLLLIKELLAGGLNAEKFSLEVGMQFGLYKT